MDDAGEERSLRLVDLARLRHDYQNAGLDETAVPADPLQLWRSWLADAQDCGLAEPNAMVVATVGADGLPSSRLVLCKEADDRGFVFFTNYGSRKAVELAGVAGAALLFPWHSLGRQVRVEGTAAPVERAESEAYFATRPRGSQLSAWASPQSEPVAGRDELVRRVAEVTDRFGDGPVPCPPYWGGIRVTPRRYEFWQGRTDRLHDRLRYEPRGGGDGWTIVRLAP